MRLTVEMEMSAVDVEHGGNSDPDELAESVRAALRELIGDDGGA